MTPNYLRSTLVSIAGMAICACATSSKESLVQVGDEGTQKADADTSTVIASDAGRAGDDCSADGWCVVECPLNGDVTLSSIWGSGPNDIWTVGSRGTIAHWDGAKWQLAESGYSQTIRKVWGSGPHDVWAFSTFSGILHSDGWTDGHAAWSMAASMKPGVPYLTADYGLKMPIVSAWGSSANDIYILAEARSIGNRSVWHMDGWNDGREAWQPISEYADLYGGITGLAADDIWAVGWNGKVARSRGYRDGIVDWELFDTSTHANLRGIWGSAPDDMWTVGARGTIRHWTYDDDGELRWLVSASGTTENLNAVWGGSATDVWAVGEGRTILHFDGKGWSPSIIPAGLPAERRFFDVWGTAAGNVWIVGDNIILRRNTRAEESR